MSELTKPLLYDVFSGAGGAAKGYQMAGFRVIGIDHKPQPRYCGDGFILMDAFKWFDRYLNGECERGQAIHTSPPCQAFTNARVIHGRTHPDLLSPVLDILNKMEIPWVVENVPGSPMQPDVILCGSQFGLRDGHLGLIRHRWFKFSSFSFQLLPRCHHSKNTISIFGHGGHIYHGVDSWRRAMGIDWMTRDELAQAIPPAYTNWIGQQLMKVLK